MNRLPKKFIKVTEHFGYRYKEDVYGYEKLFFVYRISDTKLEHPIRGCYKRHEAVRECKYLEKLNYSKEKSNDL